jgi:hypothetical protein
MKTEKLYRIILVDFENLEAAEGEVIFDKLSLPEAKERARELLIECKDNELISIEEMGDMK